MYVCMYVCIYIYIYIYRHVYRYINICVYIYLYIFIYYDILKTKTFSILTLFMNRQPTVTIVTSKKCKSVYTTRIIRRYKEQGIY